MCYTDARRLYITMTIIFFTSLLDHIRPAYRNCRRAGAAVCCAEIRGPVSARGGLTACRTALPSFSCILFNTLVRRPPHLLPTTSAPFSYRMAVLHPYDYNDVQQLSARSVSSSITPNATQRTTLIIAGCYILIIGILWCGISLCLALFVHY